MINIGGALLGILCFVVYIRSFFIQIKAGGRIWKGFFSFLLLVG